MPEAAFIFLPAALCIDNNLSLCFEKEESKLQNDGMDRDELLRVLRAFQDQTGSVSFLSVFAVFADSRIDAAELASLESQARYIIRPVFAMEALEKLDDGNLLWETPAQPSAARPGNKPGMEWMRADQPLSWRNTLPIRARPVSR
jgi:hypothetical protein